MSSKLLQVFNIALLVFFPFRLFATADGPDFYKVNNVAKNDSLNMRSGPGPTFSVVDKIPYDFTALENLGECAYQDTCSVSKSDVRIEKGTVWCRIGYRQQVGWVSVNYIAESTDVVSPKNRTAASLDITDVVSLNNTDGRWRLLALKEEIYRAFILERIMPGQTEGDEDTVSDTIRFDFLYHKNKKLPLAQDGLLLTSLTTNSREFRLELKMLGEQKSPKLIKCVLTPTTKKRPEINCNE